MSSRVLTHEQWVYQIHPERYVPRPEGPGPRRPRRRSSSSRARRACSTLQERYDKEGAWAGRSLREKAAVLTWTAYQTAGLGATAKYWRLGYPFRNTAQYLAVAPKARRLVRSPSQHRRLLSQRPTCPSAFLVIALLQCTASHAVPSKTMTPPWSLVLVLQGGYIALWVDLVHHCFVVSITRGHAEFATPLPGIRGLM